MRGDVQVLMDAPVIMLPEVRADAVKILAVSGHEREQVWPNVPTLAEVRYPAAECENWSCLVAPSHTSAELVAWLNREALSVLASPQVRKRLETLGSTPRGTTPEEVSQSDRQRAGALGRDDPRLRHPRRLRSMAMSENCRSR
jgi:tripartite-type tricarboxylate transporter receptor subunit TctC